MTVVNRRALIGRIIEREAAGGNAIDRDAEFMTLAVLISKVKSACPKCVVATSAMPVWTKEAFVYELETASDF